MWHPRLVPAGAAGSGAALFPCPLSRVPGRGGARVPRAWHQPGGSGGTAFWAALLSIHPSIHPRGQFNLSRTEGCPMPTGAVGLHDGLRSFPLTLENGVQSSINAPSCPPLPLTAPTPLILRLSWPSPQERDGKPTGNATAGRRSHPGPGAACQSGTNPHELRPYRPKTAGELSQHGPLLPLRRLTRGKLRSSRMPWRKWELYPPLAWGDACTVLPRLFFFFFCYDFFWCAIDLCSPR